MTENQRDYLADLAITKGVVLGDTDNVSEAWASAKIEELKALPDAPVNEVSPEVEAEIDDRISANIKEMQRWNFQG